MIRLVILFSILLYGATPAFCQNKKEEKSCTGSCCKKQSKEMRTANNQKKVFVCKLTTPELRKRKAEVIASLKAKVSKRKELGNGYTYLLSATDNNIDEVTSFVKTERVCCDFFNFKISVEGSDLWLTISGEKGAKEFITDEIGL